MGSRNSVFPSLAKEYVLRTTIEWREQIWIALGGPAATAIVVFLAILWASRNRKQASCAAGVLVVPAVYVIRTLFVGRSHDGLECQEAQSAIGLNPNGHALDVLFFSSLQAAQCWQCAMNCSCDGARLPSGSCWVSSELQP